MDAKAKMMFHLNQAKCILERDKAVILGNGVASHIGSAIEIYVDKEMDIIEPMQYLGLKFTVEVKPILHTPTVIHNINMALKFYNREFAQTGGRSSDSHSTRTMSATTHSKGDNTMKNIITSTTTVIKKHTNIKVGDLFENTAAGHSTNGRVYQVAQVPRCEGTGDVPTYYLHSLYSGKNFLKPKTDIEAIFGDNRDGNGGHANFKKVTSATIETGYQEVVALS